MSSGPKEESVRVSSRLRTTAKRGEEESDTSNVAAAPVARSAAGKGSRSNNNNSYSYKKPRKGSVSSAVEEEEGEEGCVVCKQDNDHANLMLCEACNGEYHIYCLNPPLEAVPDGDWFCGT